MKLLLMLNFDKCFGKIQRNGTKCFNIGKYFQWNIFWYFLYYVDFKINFVIVRYEANFHTLDIDDIQTTTINFGKAFNQLDKGLPPNKIVPKCKETIDIIKEKVIIVIIGNIFFICHKYFLIRLFYCF